MATYILTSPKKTTKKCTNIITDNIRFIRYTKFCDKNAKPLHYCNTYYISEYCKTKLNFHISQRKWPIMTVTSSKLFCIFNVIKTSSQLTQHPLASYVLGLHAARNNTNLEHTPDLLIKGIFQGTPLLDTSPHVINVPHTWNRVIKMKELTGSCVKNITYLWRFATEFSSFGFTKALSSMIFDTASSLGFAQWYVNCENCNSTTSTEHQQFKKPAIL